MSKHFLRDQLRDQGKGNFFFSAIKRSWAKQSLEQSQEYVWKEMINPSSLSFNMCPYEDIRSRAAGRDASESESMQYMQVGNYLHLMLQDQSLKIDDFLWAKPKFKTEEEQEKLEKHWPEVPFRCPILRVSGRADEVLKIKDAPVLADLKILQRPNMETWVKLKKTLPTSAHKAQVCAGIYVLNSMGVYDKKIKEGVVLYFNPCIPPNKDDGYIECYFDYDDKTEAETELLLFHNRKEIEALLAGEESSCSYPLCKEHGGK